MSVKSKILGSVAVLLAIGSISFGALNLKLPNSFFNYFDKSKTYFDMDSLEQNDFYDVNGDKFIVNREYTNDLFESNKIKIDNNTIKIYIDKNLNEKYAKSAQEAVSLYQKIFALVNPNIKIEIGDFEQGGDVFITESDKDFSAEGIFGQREADTTGLLYEGHGKDSNLERADTLSVVNIYNKSVEDLGSNELSMIFAHELGHAICGFSDYLKEVPHETEKLTIMNYNNISDLKSVTLEPKITPLDLALIIKQWGLFYNEDPTWSNPFSSKEDYLKNIDENIKGVCYTQKQLALANDPLAAHDGKVSILDYIKITGAQGNEDSLEQ